MPVLIPVGTGTIITGTMIAKGAIVVAGTSALVAATAGGAQTITGHTNEAWIQNGVNFDGYKDGVLIDTKANYNQFINENTGKFYDWFTGEKSLIILNSYMNH